MTSSAASTPPQAESATISSPLLNRAAMSAAANPRDSHGGQHRVWYVIQEAQHKRRGYLPAYRRKREHSHKVGHESHRKYAQAQI